MKLRIRPSDRFYVLSLSFSLAPGVSNAGRVILRGCACQIFMKTWRQSECIKLLRYVFKMYFWSNPQKKFEIFAFFRFFFEVFSSEYSPKRLFVKIWPLKLQNIGLTLANFLFSVLLAFFWAYLRKNRSTFF